MHKILLVEDDIFIQELYERELQKVGYQVTACGNGDDALATFAKDDFDLVMLDIMMPGKDGITVLGEMKKDPSKSKTKVLMLTNLGQDDIVQKTLQLGAAGYLIKSEYTPYQVIDEVKKYLAQ